MKKYGMVIDLHQCVGCGACALACKNENNTQTRAHGQSFNWADFIMKTEGTFPDTRYSQMPVLCNHCTDAPCVAQCPVTPKAMFKADDNTTLHNQERCIGCQSCQIACPYSHEELAEESYNKGEIYSVISFNPFKKPTQPEWRDETEMIVGCTASGAEVAKKAGALPPDANLYKSGDYQPVRKAGVVEKCILCQHRTTAGELPACVEACPASARIFGDQNDPNSNIAMALKKHKATRLKVEEGTDPNVYYIRSYNDPKV
ncbi:MAG: 4Fe-4S dicluster domain-containing protein [Desulfuromonadales bacterium]|nr:4Fe-4S dicluster domain-containing protein [Desulfuromonadales bacterium]